jgi:hypothetical protein
MKMPTYFKNITLQARDTETTSVVVVARYYAPFGGGGRDGWKIPVSPPTLTLDGVQLNEMSTIFSDWVKPVESWLPTYIEGQREGGYDQYAQYYGSQIDLTNEEQTLRISGDFEQVGYYSITLYFQKWPSWNYQVAILDSELEVEAPELNPYEEGNPSVFAYGVSTEGSTPSTNQQAINWSRKVIGANKKVASSDADQNKVDLYRPDEQSSKDRMLEGTPPGGGCSTDYLVTEERDEERDEAPFEFMVLRIKVPDMFIENSHPPKVFGDYQCRYLSISSNINKNDPCILDFWTVSGQMLEDYKDSDGYAYVFFAPTDFVKDQVELQKTPPKVPPVLTWEGYTGYLLGPPKNAIVMRYRAPNDEWEGSPGMANCYLNSTDNEPIYPGELKQYTPEIYGDSRENFESGKLGPVSKGLWPN